MAAYNAESTLARMLRPHYSRADDEARALLREAFTLSGDLHITGDTLHVRLDPATAPSRSRALHALCQQLTETGTRYPDTNLTISYSVTASKASPTPHDLTRHVRSSGPRGRFGTNSSVSCIRSRHSHRRKRRPGITLSLASDQRP